MKHSIKHRVAAVLLAAALVVGVLPINAFAAASTATSSKSASSGVSIPSDRVYITSTKYAIVPGVEELELTTNNTAGSDQRIGYLCTVDADNFVEDSIRIVACYKDYSYDALGFQTVTDQAAAYEKKTGNKVVAAVNADFFNMTTGEPVGLFVMDGTVYHANSNKPYFAILKDGTAVIREAGTDYSDVQQAVGGDQILVKDGVAQQFSGDYATIKYSRCAIGIRADGSVVTYTTHGISTPTSCGESYSDLAAMFVAQGCVIAMNLDGGGSATYASVREGTDKLAVQNSPSDGTPRTVSTTLLVVSTAAADGEFDHASLTPNNEYYTPTLASANPTTVQFEAVGVDASGASCDLPETGLTWALADGYADAGSIDQATGLFTAAKGYTGTVAVEYLYNGAVVGSTSVQIVEPDEIAFSGTGVSLDFSEATDLGLTVKGAGVALNFKAGDFTWTVDCTTDGVAADLFGTMNGNTFTSGAKQSFAMEGYVTVAYEKADGTTISARIFVEVGKMPIVALDFEDISGVQGKNVIGLWDWGTTAGYFSDGSGDQVYEFENYDTLYYLQSTTYSADSQWINEVYTTEQPWTLNEDGTATVRFEDYFGDKEYTATVESTYGEHAAKWVSFTDENGVGYYWRGYTGGDTWSGNFNAGGGSASAFLAADGYRMYVWHTSANPSTADNLHGEGSQIVDASEGEVRFGDHALKLTYDFTNFSPTGGTKNCNTYYRVTDPVVASGSPSGLGMWVYAPEGMSNFWFWTQLSYWDGSAWANAFIHFKPAGAEKTLQYTGINWTGWTYVEADLSAVYNAGAVVDAEHPLQIRSGNPLILMTYIPGGTSDGEGNAIVCGSKSEGYFYIDNVRWVYGTNVDDMDSPVILSTTANDVVLSADETTALDSNAVTFTVDFTDPQGENYSGIDETATQIFLDGKVLTSDQYSATADRAQTVELALANGEHTLEVNVSDNFGNKTSQSYIIAVNDKDSVIPTVTIDRDAYAALGGDYTVTISADDLSSIAAVSTSISYDNKGKLETKQVAMENSKFYDDYGNLLTQGADGNYYDAAGNLVEQPLRPNATGNYYVSSAVQKLGENLTGTLRNVVASNTTRTFTATAAVNETLTSDTTLLTFTLPIPASLIETDTVPVTITVTFTTTDGSTYTVSTGKVTNAVEAYYTFASGIQISGAESGTLTVYGDKVDAANLQVYANGAAIEGSWNGNVFTTSYFTSLEPNSTVKVYVGDAVNGRYSFVSDVYVCAYAASGAYNVTLNATTGDSATMQQITWLSGVDTNAANAQVQYMTRAEYEAALAAAAEGSDVFANAASVAARSELTDFVLSGVDFVAVYVNNATLTGLTPGTEYVCRAGDGTAWSAVTGFSTYTDDGSTDFVVMGDAQLHGNDTTDASAIAALQALGERVGDVDFGIQTGDFVDGGTNYTQWEQILRQYGAAFEGIDFVHTMGNHEAYTSVGTTAGTEITVRLYGLTSEETKYYSVEYGDVYVAVVNQAATSNLSEAAAWLIEDAAKTDCTWKVLVTHQPPYYTNPNGSSDGHHNVLAPACDAAGIDFVFSGHDHAYARTEQIYNGETAGHSVDAATNAYVNEDGSIAATQGEGTVYFIVGSMDPGGEYAVVNDPAFHFATATNDYNCIYLNISATTGKFTVDTYDVSASGEANRIDTYTMYNGVGICSEAETHMITTGAAVYDPATGMLICERCGAEVDPVQLSYTGFATGVNGADEQGDSQYYFFLGALKIGWFAMGEEFLYANEAGLIDHAAYTYSTNTCTENGKNMAYSPRYDVTYTGGIARYTGHSYDEDHVCTTCGHAAIDVADWNFSLAYTAATYSGTAKTPAITVQNPETGEKLEFATDGMGRLSDYIRTWSNNKNVGVATVTVEMNPNGDYYNSNGVVTLKLQIRPDLPTNVTAVASDLGAITVSWTAAKSADTYLVYYSSDGSTWRKAGSTAGTSLTVTGLNANQAYYFRIRSQATVDGTIYKSLSYTSALEAACGGGIDLSNYTVKQSWTSTVYNGAAKAYSTASLKVYGADGNELIRNTDYTVTYQDNVNVGTATIIISGKGIYEGTITRSFTITRQSLTNTAAAAVAVADAVYTADGAQVGFTVTDKNGRVMTEGVDYTVAYSNNQAVGTAKATIAGIGNYKGTIKTTYTIVPCDIAQMTAAVDSAADRTYTTLEVRPAVTVDGLTEGTDYEVAYRDNIAAGTAHATVTGIGNYTGSVTVDYEIVAADIAGATITDGSTYSYTGSAVNADLNVTGVAGELLTEGVDYEIAETVNNLNVGTAQVTIRGIGNYTGTQTHAYDIQAAGIETMTVTLQPDSYNYSGAYRTPAVTVTNQNGTALLEGTDYTVAYADNKNAGTATVTVTGTGNYTGTISRSFVIHAVDINTCTVTLSRTSYTFSGGYKKPGVTVKTARGTVLVEGKNYTVAYSDNRNAGTAKVTVTGINNYCGVKTVEFTIAPKDIETCTAALNTSKMISVNGLTVPSVTVKTAAGTTLVNGTNYTVEYSVENGVVTAVVTGMGNYQGSLTLTGQAPTDLNTCTAKLNFTLATYSGTAKRPGVTVTAEDGTVLKKGTDYTVEYQNNVEIGKATVVITGIGNYTGTMSKTFRIRPEAPTGVSVASATKTTVKVTFNRDDTADKYYIYLDGEYVGCALTVNYFTIKNLQADTSYAVTVKAVKVVDGTNYYSAASSAVTATTKP